MLRLKKDMLTVMRLDSRKELGEVAAADAKALIRALLKEKETIRAIFAAAPSQQEFLESLRTDASIDFSRIEAFHMDEYIGLAADAPQGFGNFLMDRIFGKAPFKKVHLLGGQAQDVQAECKRYAALLAEKPIDIVLMGIGENGHIAFNDPGFADFDDPELVKVVELDETCRQQQVNDGCFAAIGDVPTHAITLTVPTLINARHILCMVPAKTKANAVFNTLDGEITADCPASILRRCGNAVLYVDPDSGARLPEVRGLTEVK